MSSDADPGQALLAALEATTERISDAKADLEAAYADRLALFKQAIAAGVARQAIAKASDVSVMAVSAALGEDRRKRERSAANGNQRRKSAAR